MSEQKFKPGDRVIVGPALADSRYDCASVVQQGAIGILISQHHAGGWVTRFTSGDPLVNQCNGDSQWTVDPRRLTHVLVGSHLSLANQMSLRDYIAIHANDRDISPYTRKGPYGEEFDRENARYLYADAMLERRKK